MTNATPKPFALKTIFQIIAALCLIALIAGSAIVLTANYGALGFAAVALVTWLGWSIATWYYADEHKALAPNSPGRVTFVEVLQAQFRDLAAITKPWWMRAWLNLPFLAVAGVDAVSMLQPDAQQAIWHNPWTAGALILLNLVARYGNTAAHGQVAR